MKVLDRAMDPGMKFVVIFTWTDVFGKIAARIFFNYKYRMIKALFYPREV